jgi:N,N'-diacetyllegionaminate synthase
MNFRALQRTFVVAEIGVNHEGQEHVAADLIRAAAAAGADAVKFQTFDIEHYVSNEQRERWERTRRFQLSRPAFERLAGVAKASDVVFFSTPLGLNDVDFLERLQPLFKVSSGDLTFHALIHAVAAKRKPMILSTGTATEAEIAAAVAVVEQAWPDVKEAGGLLLTHCVSMYPTAPADANLRNISWLAERFGVPVGYSDHTLGIAAAQVAVALGAVVVEKHFTDSREGKTFHDHQLSADPSELRELIARIRSTEEFLGAYERRRIEAADQILHMRRSVGAARDILAGATIDRDDLTWLRPAWGLPPDRLPTLVGRRASREISRGSLIREGDIV